MVTAGCPDDETLARVAAGDADEAERDRVMAHLDRCTVCRRGVALLAAQPPTPADSFVGGDHESTFRETPSEMLTARVPPTPRPAGTAPAIPALGDRIGRYVALRVVGRGGMGIVIAAHDPELDRQVAIKLVHPRVWRAASDSARDLLRLEARAMARLVHPNVVAVHDLGTVGDQLFVAMELVSGSSLDQWLSAAPRPWREVVAMCCEAGKGIAAAHRGGLIHRDIKPHNVLVDEHGRPRIADFGLAMLGQGDPSNDSGGGTPAYMSPEQHRGTTATAASDQFSFCVMVYEALYGERPFAGQSVAAIGAEIEHGRVRPPPPRTRVPPAIRRVLLRGLSTDAAARFPDMDALLAALAPPPVTRWKLGAAVVALAAAAAVLGVVMLGRDDDPATAARRAAEARAAAIWSPAARRAVEATLGAGAAAHTAITRTRVLAELDQYVTRWIAARLEVARAARAGEQAPAAAERRIACLDRRLDEVRALVGAIGVGGPGVATAAIDGVHALTPAQVCLDRDVMAVRPPPEEPRRRARHDELSRAIDDVVALNRVGRRKDAAAAAERMLADVQAFDHPPLLAEAMLMRARVLETVGEADRAIGAYREVMPVAAAAGDAEIEARAWLALIAVTINAGRGRPSEEMVIAAGAAVARAGELPSLQRSHDRTLAMVAISEGRYADAEAIHRRVLAELPANHPERPEMLLSVGAALAEQRKFEEALVWFEQARDAAETLYGADHPAMALYWSNLYISLNSLGRDEEAGDAARRISAVAEPGTVTAGFGIMYEGDELLDMGRTAEAAVKLEAAVKIFHDSGNRRQEFEALMNLGATLYNAEELDRAETALAQALELGKVVFANEPAHLAYPMIVYGTVATERGDHAAGVARCTRALELLAARADDPERTLALLCAGHALRLGGRPAEAGPHFERALRDADRQADAHSRYRARVELARTLAVLGRDRARRRILAREAMELADSDEQRARIADEFRADLR